MIRSLNTVNRNMNILQKKQENAGTNIANANTPGYKYQQVIQSTLESQEFFNFTGGDGTQRRELGEWTFGNRVDEIITSFGPGNMVETEDPLDFALPGEGFFVLDLVGGERGYTKNGNFSLNAENQLVTMEGHVVVGVDADGAQTDITVNTAGEIVNGARPMTVTFSPDALLERRGETVFLDPENAAQVVGAEPVRGFLEMSNVALADEMVKLITIAREFEANQKLLQTSEDTLNKAVNEIGKV